MDNVKKRLIDVIYKEIIVFLLQEDKPLII